MKIRMLNGTPEQIAVAGALGCTDSRSSAEILDELQAMPADECFSKCGKVLADSFGRGHGSVGDQAIFQFSLEGVSRLATLFFCQSTHSSHLQQSLRRVSATTNHVPPELWNHKPAIECCDKAFALYETMVDAGIPAEDARYILPLGTETNIQVSANARELCHYIVMARSKNVPHEVKEILASIGYLVAKGKNPNILGSTGGTNFEPFSFYPAPDLFAVRSPLDSPDVNEGIVGYDDQIMRADIAAALSWIISRAMSRDLAHLSFLKHIHFTFAYPMSIAALHQAIRQRTWDMTVATLPGAVESAKRCSDGIVIPPSIGEDKNMTEEFCNLGLQMIDEYRRAVESGIKKSDAFSVLPHALKIRTMSHINGWNAIHSIGKRTCNKAQWEIWGIARQAAAEIRKHLPVLGQYANPQCMTYGQCPEKNPCVANPPHGTA